MINKMSASSMNAKTWYRSMLAGNEAFSPGAFDLIATTLISSNTASVTFDTSALSAYKHLQIRGTLKSSVGGTNEGEIRFNGVTSSSYAWHMLNGYGSGINGQNGASQTSMIIGSVVGTDQASQIYSPAIIDVLDFASTTKTKTLRSFCGSSTSAIRLSSGLFNSTNAITSITLSAGANLVSGTRLSIYGIKG